MSDIDDSPTTPFGAVRSIRKRVRESLVAGATLTLPLIVTLLLLKVTLDFVFRIFKPIGIAVNAVWPGQLGYPMAEVVAMIISLVIVFVLGVITELISSERMINGFHTLMGTIPGIGTVYLSFRRMSDALFQGDAKIFRDVKLIEYPSEGIYSFGFVTGQAPDEIEEVVGDEEMQTLFMPLAPNPVLGGRVIYVPNKYIYDINMTVEEAIHTLVTSGVVTQSRDGPTNRAPEERPAASRTRHSPQMDDQSDHRAKTQ